MGESAEKLTKAARQLLETDRALGGDFVPAGHSPLPAIEPPAAAPAAAGPAGPTLTPEQQATALEDMDAGEVRNCVACPLHAGRTHTVFGEGNPDADLVFVGEAPGAEEDRTGRPFVGRAGEKLTDMIAAMGLSRQDVYICNMLKCRPPGNRTPNPQEVECCWDFLIRQLQILQPKVIVTLGNPATQNLLDTRVGITRLRGSWQKLPMVADGLVGIDVMPTFHPAFLLRQYSIDNRKKVWSDLQEVMKLLGMEGPKK